MENKGTNASTRLVVIVYGAAGSYKTTAIKNVVALAEKNCKNKPVDLLPTLAGQLLNGPQSKGAKDIFETFEKNGKKVAVLSAGDVRSEVVACINEIQKQMSNFDVLVCAARKNAMPSVKQYLDTLFPANITIDIHKQVLVGAAAIEAELKKRLAPANIIP
ncbi:MAG: hypothetical protein IJ717_03130 [Treponema sp.]|nr:hypothetical protein [Treponema sp.]